MQAAGGATAIPLPIDGAPCTWWTTRRLAWAGKRLLDVTGAILLLALTGPILALCAALIRWTSPGPAFYAHQRVGQRGKPFRMWKLRTMYQDSAAILARHFQANPAAQEEWRQTFKLKNDPRITPLGRYLRRFSLDELPQLWNVLVGDMSLVGPRPIVVEEIERYGTKYAAYAAMRPGITGLWQISGRSDTDYERRIRLDERYVRAWSLRTDLIILLKTPGAVLRGRGAY